MNPRVVAIVTGVITTVLGLAGLLYPDRVMGMLGFAILNTANAAAVMGEVRATYGGLFVVLGGYTLLSGIDPVVHRPRLTFIALLWLGACAGRLFGAYANGNPGVPGWLSAAFELAMGGSLLAARVSTRSAVEVYVRPSPSETSPSVTQPPVSPAPTTQP